MTLMLPYPDAYAVFRKQVYYPGQYYSAVGEATLKRYFYSEYLPPLIVSPTPDVSTH
jgi:hypothetical protein